MLQKSGVDRSPPPHPGPREEVGDVGELGRVVHPVNYYYVCEIREQEHNEEKEDKKVGVDRCDEVGRYKKEVEIEELEGVEWAMRI